MPVAMLQDAEGFGAETYDAVNKAMAIESNPPEGLIFHTAGQANGVFRIFDVWESREAFERFERERLGPAIGKVMQDQGQEMGSPPQREFYELHNLMKA